METRIYTYQKKYTLADGTVRTCEFKNKYTPKNDNPKKQVRKKKEGSVYDITRAAQDFNDNDRELLREYIKKIQERNKQKDKIED